MVCFGEMSKSLAVGSDEIDVGYMKARFFNALEGCLSENLSYQEVKPCDFFHVKLANPVGEQVPHMLRVIHRGKVDHPGFGVGPVP